MPKPSSTYLHTQKWHNCTACELGKTATTHVFCRGTVPCEILFVGEAPGENEDLSGLPFVGKAGDVLNGIIDRVKEERYKDLGWRMMHSSAMLKHTNNPEATAQPKPLKDPFTYAITNILCCRPPKNRDPTAEEADACSERLWEFLNLAQPQYIVRLGKVSRTYLPDPIQVKENLSQFNPDTKKTEVKTVETVVPTLDWHHPAYLTYKSRSFREQYQADCVIELLGVVRNLVPF